MNFSGGADYDPFRLLSAEHLFGCMKEGNVHFHSYGLGLRQIINDSR